MRSRRPRALGLRHRTGYAADVAERAGQVREIDDGLGDVAQFLGERHRP
jgi:hypothetical protein